MGNNINKVIYGTSTLIDLTEDTVHPDRMYKGDTAHSADGSIVTGTAEVTVEDTMLIMPEGLCTPMGTVDPETHHWVRPEGLPDLDSVYHGETNTIYMTVDATGRISDPHVSFAVGTNGSSTKYYVQVGYIQNGEFIIESSEEKSASSTWSCDTFTRDYPVIKITSAHIYAFNWATYTAASGSSYYAQHQPIIEWIGHCEQLNVNIRTCYFTEREKINVDIVSNNFLQYRWQNAYCLQDLDVSEWDTSAWTLTRLDNTWNNCYKLRFLDVSNWDTSNWNIAHMGTTWGSCYILEYLDLSSWNTSNWTNTSLNTTWSGCKLIKAIDTHTWDTSNWAVTAMNQTWYQCQLLEYLDLSNWDTSNWRVTGANFRYTWNNCVNLKYLDVHTWDTSEWSITNINETWRYCFELKILDLSHWDTSNWSVTALACTWGDCRSLTYLGIHTWDTSKWVITSLQYTWYTCTSLEHLDLSHWDTSKWVITDFSNTWNGCGSLKTLDISTWDVSNWAVKSMPSTWTNCRSLERLEIGNWDVSNWVVEDIGNTWNNCLSLTELPIDDWDVTDWNVKTCANCFISMPNLIKLNLTKWNISNWPLSTSKYFTFLRDMFSLTSFDFSFVDISKIDFTNGSTYNFSGCSILQHLTFGSINSGKYNPSSTVMRLNQSTLLTRQSLLNTIDILKSGVSGKTLQLSTANLNKLSADEKAIATNKGWTLVA